MWYLFNREMGKVTAIPRLKYPFKQRCFSIVVEKILNFHQFTTIHKNQCAFYSVEEFSSNRNKYSAEKVYTTKI